MAISDTITSMYDNVGNAYNVLTLAGADLTNVDKNLVNLTPTWKERLLYFMNNGTDEVWNNWSKVNGSGTSPSINNTVEAPMSIEYKGQTSQEGTPTPSSPQDIHTVSGDNSIEVVGKNLFKAHEGTTITSANVQFTRNDDGTITLNGTSNNNGFVEILYAFQSGTNQQSNVYMPLDSSSTYTASLKQIDGTTTTTDIRFITQYDSTGNQQTIYINNSQIISNSNGLYRAYIRIPNGSTFTNLVLGVQIEKGNQATTYTPYTSNSYEIDLGDIELNKISTYQDYIRKSTGKNLTDMTTYAGGNIGSNGATSTSGVSNFSYNNGTITFTTTSTYRGTYSDYIEVKGNTDYTLSYTKTTSGVSYFSFLNYYDSSKTFISRTDISSSGKDTTPSNCKYIRILIGITTTATASVSNIMLNEGTTALPYEPYGKIWYKYGAIGKVVLNGSENGWINEGGGAPFKLPLDNIYRDNSLAGLCSNYYIGVSYSSNWNTYNYLVSTNQATATIPGIKFRNTDITSIGDWKTWLSTHNTTVYYILETPTYTEITDECLIKQLEALKSKSEQTNISQVANDLPFELSATALEG